jgi:hypothetical protein
MRYICHKNWLGGWLLPQQKSYFAVQLPHGWWVFGFDQALHGDIDIYQFKFFFRVGQNTGSCLNESFALHPFCKDMFRSLDVYAFDM